MSGRLGIDDVVPEISGNYPAKAVVGEVFPVHATVWREGHDAISATLVVRGPRGTKPLRIPMDPGTEPDTVDAVFTPSAEGMWSFRIEAWSDPIATWKHAVEAKLAVGQGVAELANDLEIGARLFEQAAHEVPRGNRSRLEAVTASLRSDQALTARVAPAFASDVAELLRATPLRELVTKGESHPVVVDRNRALFGSWYEFFPRSTGGWDENGVPQHGTFRTSAEELPRIAAMGFDVVYLPPIHPIGEINRKGRNNTLTPEPGDVGSPWAIGSVDGGHDAVHPQLGTLKDFKAFVAAARKLDLEVALDLRAAVRPGSSMGQEASGVVQRPSRRHHRLRREPAQEVSGHLPDQLRHRSSRSGQGNPASRPTLDQCRRQDLPGRQPAHQAAELLGDAHLGGQEDRPRRPVPRRGIHSSGAHVRPCPARVHTVVHVLHLASCEVGAHRIR